MKHIIRPQLKMLLRVSLIMSVLFALIFLVYGLFLEGLATFIISFLVSFLFFSSFKIVLSNEYLRFYQVFILLPRIRLSEIKDIRYVNLAKNGQRCALEIRLKNKKIKGYPIRLFSRKDVNELIESVRTLCNLKAKDGFADGSSIYLPRQSKK